MLVIVVVITIEFVTDRRDIVILHQYGRSTISVGCGVLLVIILGTLRGRGAASIRKRGGRIEHHITGKAGHGTTQHGKK